MRLPETPVRCVPPPALATHTPPTAFRRLPPRQREGGEGEGGGNGGKWLPGRTSASLTRTRLELMNSALMVMGEGRG